MIQYCYFHPPVTNRTLTWNCSVDQVMCILGAVVVVRIHFGKEKLLTLLKSRVSAYCFTLLYLGGNRFKCSG